jgi:hypothetical protein
VVTRAGTAILPEGRGAPDQNFGHGSKAARKRVIPEQKCAVKKVIRRKAARPGTVALREIVKMQRKTDLLIPRLPF